MSTTINVIVRCGGDHDTQPRREMSPLRRKEVVPLSVVLNTRMRSYTSAALSIRKSESSHKEVGGKRLVSVNAQQKAETPELR
ncbi:hypothetical protein CEXT_757851 [Caerostris extrusa]|uniref:Uncharacterized protein n=1 Tax=Caerostris extrusa TaxID=172846 RepID=A0AAV4P5E4_CAEEX|nr:hypothetical protein CEXT_757851 [Caerostris extrusa]